MALHFYAAQACYSLHLALVRVAFQVMVRLSHALLMLHQALLVSSQAELLLYRQTGRSCIHQTADVKLARIVPEEALPCL
jgi:hypothetical protein